MKTSVALALLTSSLVLPTFGQGSAVMIKNRAKEAVNQNNVRQGVPPPAPPPAPLIPAHPSGGTPVVPQAQSLEKLKVALTGFKTGAISTPEQKQQFLKDLAFTARSTKPSLPTTKRFVDSLTAALTEVTLTSDQRARLAQDLDSVLNSKPLTTTQFEAVIADVQAILQVGSLKRAAAVHVANDLKAVGAEVRR